MRWWKLAGLFDRAIIRKAKPLRDWVNDSDDDARGHQRRRPPESSPLSNGQNAEEVADRNPQGETDGTYTGALPKASSREVLPARQCRLLRTVNTMVRTDKLGQSSPKSASTA